MNGSSSFFAMCFRLCLETECYHCLERRIGATGIAEHNTNMSAVRQRGLGWRVALGVCLLLLSLLLVAVPFLTSGADLWLGIDWIDGRKLFSIDDAYRFFVARNAFRLETVFLWNYVLPLGLLFDATVATLTSGNLLIMRIGHAVIGALTLALIARGSLKAGCGPVLALASVLIVGLMPAYLIVSSSFYGEGLFAFLLALAFVLLIEERMTLLAVIVGLSSMVRPEGVIYCALFLGYFGMRRDAKRCALVALPGLVYLAAMFSLSPDWRASMAWRLELREILAPLDLGDVQSISLDRLLNPLWAGFALVPLFTRRYRKWWPILAGPIFVIGIQAAGIWRGVQDYELRYYFSLIPVFGIAWALPLRGLLDANAALPLYRSLIATIAGVACVAVVTFHLLQSDWIRLLAADPNGPQSGAPTPQNVSTDFGDKAWRFDSKPLRAFAGRVDAFVAAREAIRTVFIADPTPLYFLDFERDGAHRELVLIPHDPAIARYSGGFFFGFSLQHLAHRYYRFEAVEDAPAVLIVKDSGADQFYIRPTEPADGAPPNPRYAPQRVAAKIQSGSLKVFGVLPAVRNDVVWSIPRRASAQ
jgi:hypothetical protein